MFVINDCSFNLRKDHVFPKKLTANITNWTAQLFVQIATLSVLPSIKIMLFELPSFEQKLRSHKKPPNMSHRQARTLRQRHFRPWPPEARARRRCELVLASREPGGSSGWRSAGTARSCCKLSRLRSKPGIDQLKLDKF